MIAIANKKSFPRPSLIPERQRDLENYFREDILLLEHLLGCDLSRWFDLE